MSEVGNGCIEVIWARGSVCSCAEASATMSSDGKIIIPPEFRGSADLRPGDTLDIQLSRGANILRKHERLTAEQCAGLLERSRAQSKPTPEEDVAVEQA